MKFRDLKKSLAENLQAVYLIEGEDAFLRENALRLIKERGLQEPDLNLTNLSGQEIKQDPESFLTAVQSYPFMSDKRYVVVRDYTPSATELKGKVIKRVFQEPIDTAVIVIVNSEKCGVQFVARTHAGDNRDAVILRLFREVDFCADGINRIGDVIVVFESEFV